MSWAQSQMILTLKGLLLDENWDQMTVAVILKVLKWLELMLDQKTPEQCQTMLLVDCQAFCKHGQCVFSRI